MGSNDSATLVLEMLEAVSDAHENLCKVLELIPKLLQSVLLLYFVPFECREFLELETKD